MGRFMKDIYLGCPQEAVEKVVQGWLSRNGFHKALWKGVNMWGADAVCATDYRLFDYSYQNGNLHIEAFLRQGKTEELDLNGWQAIGDRKAYLESIVVLLQEIVALAPENRELSVDGVLGEMHSKILKKYRIVWPVVIGLVVLLFLLPYLM